MNKTNKHIIGKVLILLLVAILSITVFGKIGSSPKTYEKTIKSLDDKRNTVLELAAASAGVSTALTLIPGDTATPIADQLADLSKYFLFILCAILLEKYLVTITGFTAFYLLIPLACGMLLIYLFWKKEFLKVMAKKLLLFSAVIVLAIPGSVKVSNIIENTYSSSIDKTIKEAKDSKSQIEDSTKDSEQEDEQGFFSGIVSKIKGGVTNVTEKVSNLINKFIEAIAVLIVTSCLIPVLVLLFLVWFTKTLFKVSSPTPDNNTKALPDKSIEIV